MAQKSATASSVERVAEGVGDHDGPRAIRQGRFQPRRVHVVGRQVHVEEHGDAAVLKDRVDRGREARRHGDDLVARLEPLVAEFRRSQSGQGDEVGAGAGVDEQRIAEAEHLGELRLELAGVAAGGEPEVERGVHEMLHVVGVEDLAADGHGVHAGPERPLRPRLGEVPLDQFQDFLSIRTWPLPSSVPRICVGPHAGTLCVPPDR